jgi:hypothetical protein
MGWPPQVGDPLPRAAECWYEQAKLDEWILDSRGHGLEWERVFRVSSADRNRVWEALAGAAIKATIVEVRDRAASGVLCGVRAQLVIGERSAAVIMSWHYAAPDAAPRLVTAYPSP